MTYNISQEIKTIAENKGNFKFNLKEYNYEMSAIFETYESEKNKDKQANLLCDISIASILLVGNNIGFDKIETSISAAKIKSEDSEIAGLKRLISVIPNFLNDEISAKANIKSALRTLSGLAESKSKNFRQFLKAEITALLA